MTHLTGCIIIESELQWMERILLGRNGNKNENITNVTLKRDHPY